MRSWRILILMQFLGLSSCMTAADREHADDSLCATARDYGICRQNLMSGRRDSAIRSSGDDIPAGPPHHWSLD
jgi:hypothetical protein